MALDTSGWNIDHSQNPALYKIADTLQDNARYKQQMAMRKQEIDYRHQKDKESDDWKKLGLIQELTNTDKYQTGEATADAIGNQKAAEVLQKYTAAAGSMSPMELQAKISQDMQKTALGMGGLKDELTQSDKNINALKQLYPSINTSRLRAEHRKEILSRRLKDDTDFQNPLDINPSAFKLDDPDFLSYFTEGSKGLTDAIKNPKYSEKVKLAMGSPSSYTTLEGNLPYYRKLNYDPKSEVVGGFYKGKKQPSMDLMSSKAKFRDKEIEVLDDQPFSILEESHPLEIRSAARQKYPDYDMMSSAEKEVIKREVALDVIKSIDKSGFDFGTATKPPHYSTNNYIGGGFGGAGEARGNLIDKIDLSYYGSPQNGRIDDADVKIIPADLQAVLKSSGIDISDSETFQVEIENGKIIAITPSGGKRIDRVAVENAQKKFNTEGQKQAQPDFESVTPRVKQPDGGRNNNKETIAEKMRRLANQR